MIDAYEIARGCKNADALFNIRLMAEKVVGFALHDFGATPRAQESLIAAGGLSWPPCWHPTTTAPGTPQCRISAAGYGG